MRAKHHVWDTVSRLEEQLGKTMWEALTDAQIADKLAEMSRSVASHDRHQVEYWIGDCRADYLAGKSPL